MRLFSAISLLLICAPCSAQADVLGRLFFTPEQRSQLDYRHAHPNSADASLPSALMVNGIVQQRGGSRTVWINGALKHPAHNGEASAETIVEPGKSMAIKIKVGQKLLLDKASLPQTSVGE